MNNKELSLNSLKGRKAFIRSLRLKFIQLWSQRIKEVCDQRDVIVPKKAIEVKQFCDLFGYGSLQYLCKLFGYETAEGFRIFIENQTEPANPDVQVSIELVLGEIYSSKLDSIRRETRIRALWDTVEVVLGYLKAENEEVQALMASNPKQFENGLAGLSVSHWETCCGLIRRYQHDLSFKSQIGQGSILDVEQQLGLLIKKGRPELEKFPLNDGLKEAINQRVRNSVGMSADVWTLCRMLVFPTLVTTIVLQDVIGKFK